MYPSIRLSSPRGISSTNCTTNPAEQLESSCFARANCLILAAGNEESKLFSLSSFDFIEQGALVSIRKEKLRNCFPFVNVFVILVSVFNVSRNEGFIFCDSVYSTDKTVYIISTSRSILENIHRYCTIFLCTRICGGDQPSF